MAVGTGVGAGVDEGVAVGPGVGVGMVALKWMFDIFRTSLS